MSGRGVRPESILIALAEARYDVSPPVSISRTLLDTFDGRLRRAGLRLEAHGHHELELVLRGRATATAQAMVQVIPRVAADLPTGPLRARLSPILDIRALLPLLVLDGRRASAVRRNDAGKAVVGVDVYTGLAGASVPVETPWLAEISAYEGYPDAAKQAVKLLESLGMERCPGDFHDVVAADAGLDVRGFSGSPTVALDRTGPAAAGFLRVLANLAATIDRNWQGTVDDIDPEFLHDFRVAIRRTRSVLVHAKGVLPADGRDHFRSEFRWLGAVTTPARDLDVYLIEWPGYVAPLGEASADLLPVVDYIARRRAAAHTELAAVLRSARYRAGLAAWQTWMEAWRPAADGEKALRPLGPLVAVRLADAQRRVLARGRDIDPTSPAEALHELRKDTKKLRYLLECFGGLLPDDARSAFVKRLKALQENLGEHQDTEVHMVQLRTMSSALLGEPGVGPETMLAMGRLAELFDRRRVHARDVFAARFAAYDSDETARDLKRLLKAAAKP